jgi:hypothetical protein
MKAYICAKKNSKLTTPKKSLGEDSHLNASKGTTTTAHNSCFDVAAGNLSRTEKKLGARDHKTRALIVSFKHLGYSCTLANKIHVSDEPNCTRRHFNARSVVYICQPQVCQQTHYEGEYPQSRVVHPKESFKKIDAARAFFFVGYNQ